MCYKETLNDTYRIKIEKIDRDEEIEKDLMVERMQLDRQDRIKRERDKEAEWETKRSEEREKVLVNENRAVQRRKLSPGIVKMRQIFEKEEIEKLKEKTEEKSKVEQVKNTFESMMSKEVREKVSKTERERARE